MSPTVPERKGGFNLDDYVTVAERIAEFYVKYPDGSLQSDLIELTDSRVVIRASAYRTANDERPAVAHSALGIPGTTPYTRGSEIENAETSAVGRAIALLGFGVKKSIASADELRGKQTETIPAPAPRDDGGLIGIVEVGTAKDSDLELRQTPEGYAIGFRLKGDRGGIKVVAHGELAEAIGVAKSELVGQRVTCYGRVRDETFTPKNSTRKVTYQVLDLSRIVTPEYTLPEVTEAPSVPLFSDAEEAELDAALPA